MEASGSVVCHKRGKTGASGLSVAWENSIVAFFNARRVMETNCSEASESSRRKQHVSRNARNRPSPIFHYVIFPSDDTDDDAP